MKNDRRSTKRFLKTCLKRLNLNQWRVRLQIGGDHPELLGLLTYDIETWRATITVYADKHNKLADLQDTIAHECIELAMALAHDAIRPLAEEAVHEYIWQLMHQAINPLAEVLARAVHGELTRQVPLGRTKGKK